MSSSAIRAGHPTQPFSKQAGCWSAGRGRAAHRGAGGAQNRGGGRRNRHAYRSGASRPGEPRIGRALRFLPMFRRSRPARNLGFSRRRFCRRLARYPADRPSITPRTPAAVPLRRPATASIPPPMPSLFAEKFSRRPRRPDSSIGHPTTPCSSRPCRPPATSAFWRRPSAR